MICVGDCVYRVNQVVKWFWEDVQDEFDQEMRALTLTFEEAIGGSEGTFLSSVTGLQRASKVLISVHSHLSSAPIRENLMMYKYKVIHKYNRPRMNFTSRISRLGGFSSTKESDYKKVFRLLLLHW